MKSAARVRRQARPRGVAVQRPDRDDRSPDGLPVGTHDPTLEPAAAGGFQLGVGMGARSGDCSGRKPERHGQSGGDDPPCGCSRKKHQASNPRPIIVFTTARHMGDPTMQSGERESESRVNPIGARKYTAASASRHRSGAKRRLFYFALASTWGFIIGVGGLLAAMSAAGQAAQPNPGTIVGLIPALLFATAGGFVISAAYKESKRRR